jgi:hypothetical protein
MRYYLATNEIDIFHFGEIEDESILTTGQPKVFYFDSEDELKNKVNILSKDFTYYDTIKSQEIDPLSIPSNPGE